MRVKKLIILGAVFTFLILSVEASFLAVSVFAEVSLKVDGMAIKEKIKNSTFYYEYDGGDHSLREKLFSTLKKTPEKNHDLAEVHFDKAVQAFFKRRL